MVLHNWRRFWQLRPQHVGCNSKLLLHHRRNGLYSGSDEPAELTRASIMLEGCELELHLRYASDYAHVLWLNEAAA